MAATTKQRRLAAIMFSDIVGYSRLMNEDETATLALLQEHNAILIPIIQRHNGAVLKFIGDAILSSFESAADAVHCAVAIQKELAKRNVAAAKPLLLRIGVHIGDVTEQQGEIFGDGVNIAARIQPLAEPGGICISQTVYHVVRAQPEIRVESMGERELKNIKENVHIYKVQVADGPAIASSSKRASTALALSAAALVIASLVALRLRQLSQAPVRPAAVTAAPKAPAPAPSWTSAPTSFNAPQKTAVARPKAPAAAPSSARLAQGHRHDAAGDHVRAAQEYRSELETSASVVNAALAALYYHGVAWRVGSTKNSSRALERFLAAHAGDNTWPLPLVRLYAGALSEEQARAAAGDPAQACQAHYFLGIRALLAPEARDSYLPSKASRSRAQQFFKQAAASCAANSVERRQAQLELERLNH